MNLMPDHEAPRSRHATQLDRIEAKLDRLIAVRAEDEEGGQAHDREGNPMPALRGEHEEL